MMVLYDLARKPVALETQIARGGEGVVYTVRGQDSLLGKVYLPMPGEGHEDKLRWMLAHPPDDSGGPTGHASIAWPHDLLFDSQRRFLGYLMPHIQHAVPILRVFNPRSRAVTLPAFDRRYLHRAARNLAHALAALHRGGYVVGDLNESNVLVTATSLVTLIDSDSFQVQEPKQGRIIVYPCPVGKQEYTAPELQGRAFSGVVRTWEHDAFALGVMIFQLLMEGNHPFRARWLGQGDPPPIEERIRRGYFPYAVADHSRGTRPPVAPPPNVPAPEWLHPSLATLIRRCFVEGTDRPGERPPASEWEAALLQAETALVACGQGHFYDSHLRACPVCGSGRAARQAPTSRKTTQVPPPPGPGPAPRRAPAGQPSAGHATGGSGTAQRRTPGNSPPRNPAQAPDFWAVMLKSLWDSFMGGAAGATGAAGGTRAAGGGSGGSATPAGSAARTSSSRSRSAGSKGAKGNTLLLWTLGKLAGRAAAQARPSAGSGVIRLCARCGWPNDSDEIYCQRCAYPLAGTRDCPNCGQPMPLNTRYCTNCSTRV